MRPARADRLDVPEEIAEAARELGVEARRVELEQAFGDRRRVRSRRSTSDARPPRCRCIGRMANGPPGRNFSCATPRCGRSWRATSTIAIWSYDQARAPMPASSRIVPKRPSAEATRRAASRRPLFSAISTLSAPRLVSSASSGATSSTLGQACKTPQHRGAQEAVLDDPAHRRGIALGLGRLAMIEMQEEGAGAAVVAGIGDADVEDRLGAAFELVPHADRLEKPLAGVGDRRGAAVEAGLGQRRRAARGRSAPSAAPPRPPPGPAGCRSGRRRRRRGRSDRCPGRAAWSPYMTADGSCGNPAARPSDMEQNVRIRTSC